MGLFAPGRRHAFFGQPGHDGAGQCRARDRPRDPVVPAPAEHAPRDQHRPTEIDARDDAALAQRARIHAPGRIRRDARVHESDGAPRGPGAKIEALRRLREAGYRIVAVVDNEPSLIRAMADADTEGHILFLHPDTIFVSHREPTPRTVSGSVYGLSGLVDEADVGRRVTFVWRERPAQSPPLRRLRCQVGRAGRPSRPVRSARPSPRLVHGRSVVAGGGAAPAPRLSRGPDLEPPFGQDRPEGGWRCHR